MTRALRLHILFSVSLCAAGLIAIVVWLSRSPSGSNGKAPVPTATSTAQKNELALVDETGARAGGEVAGSSSNRTLQSGANPIDNATRYAIRGRVQLPAGSSERPTITIAYQAIAHYQPTEDPTRIHPSADGEGAFSADVTRLLRAPPWGEIGPLVVQARHPWCFMEEAVVSTTDFAPEREDAELRVARVDITLRTACVITGRVVDEFNEPIAGGDVRILHGLLDALPYRPIDTVKTEANGVFRFALVPPGDVLLLILAEGYEPFVERLFLDDNRLQPLGVLALNRGATIEGHCLLRTEQVAPLRVQALALEAAGERVHYGPSMTLDWTGDRAAWVHVRSAVGDDGGFALRGLCRGCEYFVSLAGSSRCTMPRKGANTARVVAPRSGVELDDPLPRVRFRVVAADTAKPIENAEVKGTFSGGAIPCYTDEHGELVWVLAAGVAYSFEISASGFGSVRRNANEAPGVDRREFVELERIADAGAIEVLVRDGESGTSIPFNLSWSHAHERIGRSHDGDACRVDGLLPDSYELMVSAADQDTFFVPGRVEVIVQPGETSKLTVLLKRGGKLAIELSNAGEVGRWVPCRVRDSRRMPVEVRFVRRSGGASEESQDSVRAGAAFDVDPPLEPGTYFVQWSDGEAGWREAVAQVEVGETFRVQGRVGER